jgi:hypothetical protein
MMVVMVVVVIVVLILGTVVTLSLHAVHHVLMYCPYTAIFVAIIQRTLVEEL